MGRNPTLVHILGSLHPRSGVAIRHVLRKLQGSPDLESIKARMYYHYHYDYNDYYNYNYNCYDDYSWAHLRELDEAL